MQRWPNVPALFGWLGLDRRGRWLIQGEVISRPQIIDTINRNYEPDPYGRWFFQNGPQRGFIRLDHAPLVLRVQDDSLITHTELKVERPSQAFLDEEGALLLLTEHGPGAIADTDLDWALGRLSRAGQPIDEDRLAHALSLPSGEMTDLSIAMDSSHLLLMRLDRSAAPARLNFVRDPQPRENEAVSTRISD